MRGTQVGNFSEESKLAQVENLLNRQQVKPLQDVTHRDVKLFVVEACHSTHPAAALVVEASQLLQMQVRCSPGFTACKEVAEDQGLTKLGPKFQGFPFVTEDLAVAFKGALGIGDSTFDFFVITEVRGDD